MSHRLFGLLTYLHASTVSLPPIFLLILLPADAWYWIGLKVIGAVWLLAALLSHLVFAMESDRRFGRRYRKTRAGYVYVMIFVALMLWDPHRVVFWIGVGGFLFFSAGYTLAMQKIFNEKTGR